MTGNSDPRADAASAAMVRSPEVLWRHLPDGVLVLPADGTALRIVGSASQLWELLAVATTLPAAVDVLSARFGAPAERIERDIAPLWDELAERAVLRPCA